MQKHFRIYRANKSGTGSASSWEFKIKEEKRDEYTDKVLMVFLTSAKQLPPKEGEAEEFARFAWNRKECPGQQVILKLGEADVGEFLAVLNGKKPNIGSEKGLYHKNDNGNTAITFVKGDSSYSMRVSSQDKDRNLVAVQHGVTFGEGEILKVLLTKVLEDYFA